MTQRRKGDVSCPGDQVEGPGAGFKLYDRGVDRKRNGEGLILKEEQEKEVVDVHECEAGN